MNIFLLLGAMSYCIVGVLAFSLSEFSPGRHLPQRERRNWRVVGVIFVALAVWRLTQGELWVLDHVRAWSRLHHHYEGRRALQVPVTIGLAAIALVTLLWLVFTGLTRFSKLAVLATFTLVLFSLVRLVSLHVVDWLLYRSAGPVHLNYLIDIVLTGGVTLLACLDILRGQRQRVPDYTVDVDAPGLPE